MPQSVTGLFVRYAALLRSRNLREAARFYRFPCLIEFPDRTVVAMNIDQLEALLVEWSSHIAAAEVIDVTARVAAVEMPRENRFRAWVRWAYHYPDRIEPDGAGVIYYLTRSPGGLIAIEMLSYFSMAPIEAAARESSRIS